MAKEVAGDGIPISMPDLSDAEKRLVEAFGTDRELQVRALRDRLAGMSSDTLIALIDSLVDKGILEDSGVKVTLRIKTVL